MGIRNQIRKVILFKYPSRSSCKKMVHPQNVRFQNVRFQNVWFQNFRFQNVRFTKRHVYKTSGFKTSGFKTPGFKTSIKIKASIRPVFVFDILIKQKSLGIAKFAFLFKIKSVSFLLITSDYGDIWQKTSLK
jgi:hypothetical protein